MAVGVKVCGVVPGSPLEALVGRLKQSYGGVLGVVSAPTGREGQEKKVLDNTLKIIYNIEHPGGAIVYIDKIREIQELINTVDWIVGFNLKFDIHWLRRYGVQFPETLKVWDLQIGIWILNHQENHIYPHRYPALNDVSDRYSNPRKLDTIKENYWDKGIDTDQVPWKELETYLDQDIEVTDINLQSQLKEYENYQKKKQLVIYQGQDLLCLEEMEWNGLPYDKDESLELSRRIQDRLSDIDSQLTNLVGSSVPLNYASNDDKSVLLYGGTIVVTVKTPLILKDGTISTKKSKKELKKYFFPQLVQPPKGSALKKHGYYSTDEGTLKKCKTTGKAKKIIDLLLERAKLCRLDGTYYAGLPRLMDDMDWGSVVHGSLNQCVAVTGRLSSDKPNLQNNPSDVDKLFNTRFN